MYNSSTHVGGAEKSLNLSLTRNFARIVKTYVKRARKNLALNLNLTGKNINLAKTAEKYKNRSANETNVNTEKDENGVKIVEEVVFVNTENDEQHVKIVEEVVFVNTEEYEDNVKIVEVVVFVNTEDNEQNVKSVEGVVFVNTEENEQNVKSVEEVLFVNTENNEQNVSSANRQGLVKIVDKFMYVQTIDFTRIVLRVTVC
jgi:hypothetical protein